MTAADDPENIADRFRRLRLRADLTLDELAKAMGYKAASSIQRYEKAETFETENRLDLRIVEKLLPAIEGKGRPPIQRDEVLSLAGLPPRLSQILAFPNPFHKAVEGAMGESTMPIYGPLADDAPDRVFMPREPKVVGLTVRPAQFANVPDAFAVYCPNDSGGPFLRKGQILLIDPNLPTPDGCAVLVVLDNDQAFAGELVENGKAHVVIRHYRPKIHTVRLPLGEVRRLYKIAQVIAG